MKTGNTLRTAKNSLLCFFMALAGGFLVACGGDGVRFTGGDGVGVPASPSGHPTSSQPASVAIVDFSAYLLDTAAEGVAYSGPTGNGVTGEGGVFLASEGVFEFSIGATDLGRVSLNSEWEDNEVTPADFMGVDDAQVITIARIMQGLDSGNDLEDGISISQLAREHTLDLFSDLDRSTLSISGIVISGEEYTIPSVADARDHLADTRKCLFSGGYVGDYSGTDPSNSDAPLGGRVYYAVEPFANRVKRFGLDAAAVESLMNIEISAVGVTGSEISLSSGNTLSFTPRFVTGTWETLDGSDNVIGTGTHTLSLAADTGNPGATRRIVGVQVDNSVPVDAERLYVLDHFSGDGSFRGQLINVVSATEVMIMPLSLTIANGGSWPAVATVDATMLTLIGDNATITVGVVRTNDNYGSFDGVNIGSSNLSGTWCDIGGAVGSTVAPTPPTPLIEITVMWNEVPGATSYKLYRLAASGGTLEIDIPSTATLYVDKPPAGPEYSYQLEACNSAGCSERSSDPAPAAGGGDGGDGGDGGGGNGAPPVDPVAGGGDGDASVCMLQTYTAGQSCEWKGFTFSVTSEGRGTYAFFNAGSAIRQNGVLNGVQITFVAVNDGSGVWEIEQLG